MVLVYDVTELETFQHIESWINEALKKSEQDCKFALLGNKIDLGDLRVVTKEDVDVRTIQRVLTVTL
jgi:Ras-related protein Rab-6A